MINCIYHMQDTGISPLSHSIDFRTYLNSQIEEYQILNNLITHFFFCFPITHLLSTVPYTMNSHNF